MIKKATLLISIMLSSSAIAVKAKDFSNCNIYCSLGVGGPITQSKVYHLTIDDDYRAISPKDNSVYLVSLGKKVVNNFRIEAEFLYGSKARLNYTEDIFHATSNMSNHSYFLNVLYDFTNFSSNSNVIPYIGLGIGLSENLLSQQTWTVKNKVVTEVYDTAQNTSFAWNIGAGFMLKVYKNLVLDFSYRYLNIDKIQGSRIATYPDKLTTDFYNVQKRNFGQYVLLVGMIIKF